MPAKAGISPLQGDPSFRWGDGLGVGYGLGALAAILLTACSPASDQPGAVSSDEARQLNEAAAMLDANSVDLNALPANAPPANESQPPQ